mmetsp:Transcript_35826/g.88163  ORF Transcript_35826/g.88163 Transcript_35826/m.88163 type:complete len:322 (-) Transcript_35826:688-1653(-)
MHRAKIIPPFRFAIVENGLYRGAYPTLKNFPYLQTLNLKTIISLTPEPPTLDLDDFCALNGIELLHYMVEKPKDEVSMGVKDIEEVVQTIIKPSKLPLYIHCLDGTDVTGLIICCLRRLQAWHKDAVDNEFLRFSRTGELTVEKLVASFKEIEISEEEPPSWLWHETHHMHTHPFIKLIKHLQGVVVQVVQPAPKEARKKEVISRQPTLSAMKRPRKAVEKRKHELQDHAEDEEDGHSRKDYPDSRKGSLIRVQRDDADTLGSESGLSSLNGNEELSNEDDDEEDDEGDDLDGYPSLLEALSLHNFSDNSKSFSQSVYYMY